MKAFRFKSLVAAATTATAVVISAAPAAAKEPGLDDHYDYLPMWRWGSATDVFTDLGVSDVVNTMIIGLAQLFLVISAWLWQIVAFAVRNALELEIINDALPTIDEKFRELAGPISSSNLLILMMGLGVLATGYQVVRAGGTGAMRNILGTFLPLALLFGMANAALTGSAGSPSWTAEKANALTTDLADISGELFAGLTAEEQTIDTSCDAYIGYLENKFRVAVNGGESNPYQRIPLFVSSVWEQSYLRAYGNSQFGRGDSAWRAACRRAETVSGISAVDQWRLWRGTCGSAMPDLYQCGASSGTYNEAQLADIFGPYDGKEDHKVAFSVWMGCEWLTPGSIEGSPHSYDGNTRPFVVDEWWGLHRESGSGVGNNNFHPFDGETCEAFWEDSGGIGVDRTYVRERANFGAGQINGARERAISNGDRTEYDSLNEAVYNVRAYVGHQQGNAALNGVLSALVAVVYLISLGGLAAGAILAQIIFVVVLLLLPLLLLALAWPSPRSTEIAMKIVKLLIGAACSKVLFIAALGATVLIIQILYGIVGSAAEGASFGAVLLRSLIPFAALKAMTYVFKQFGMDISGFKGAIQTSSGMAAASMDSGGFGRASQNPISRGVRRQKYMMERRATEAPRRWMRKLGGNGTAGAAGAGAGAGAAAAMGSGAGGGGGAPGGGGGTGGGSGTGSGPNSGGGGNGAPTVIPASSARGGVNRGGRKFGVGSVLGGALGAAAVSTGGGFVGSTLGTMFGPAGWIVGGFLGSKVGRMVGARAGNLGLKARRGVGRMRDLNNRGKNGQTKIQGIRDRVAAMPAGRRQAVKAGAVLAGAGALTAAVSTGVAGAALGSVGGAAGIAAKGTAAAVGNPLTLAGTAAIGGYGIYRSGKGMKNYAGTRAARRPGRQSSDPKVPTPSPADPAPTPAP